MSIMKTDSLVANRRYELSKDPFVGQNCQFILAKIETAPKNKTYPKIKPELKAFKDMFRIFEYWGLYFGYNIFKTLISK